MDNDTCIVCFKPIKKEPFSYHLNLTCYNIIGEVEAVPFDGKICQKCYRVFLYGRSSNFAKRKEKLK